MHIVMMMLYIITSLFIDLVGRKMTGSVEIHKYYGASLVSRQLSQHILMDVGLLCNKGAIFRCMIKQTFCKRPAKSWDDY